MRRRCLRLYRQAKVFHEGTSSRLVQPLTYMNRSGMVAHHFIPGLFAVDDLVVVCDNLDLPPGMIRIRRGGSSAGHNGLKSLIEHLGSGDFVRIYVGIGRPRPPVTVVEHVLQVPVDEGERIALRRGIALASEAIVALCAGSSVEEVARAYNRRNAAD